VAKHHGRCALGEYFLVPQTCLPLSGAPLRAEALTSATVTPLIPCSISACTGHPRGEGMPGEPTRKAVQGGAGPRRPRKEGPALFLGPMRWQLKWDTIAARAWGNGRSWHSLLCWHVPVLVQKCKPGPQSHPGTQT